ncbi:hypothetical protein BV22DRAFT_210925 [Leucogyrophana mollusca]|uniref:Uncharacterized protein n=1 Tax=Leucogyrophana mollusca TaxID=85980 RepID=A0ACB8BQV0_9AGAM|nr:hypothetical protein BV22DRAFT_210925 [Leucogyrophana mollusca]
MSARQAFIPQRPASRATSRPEPIEQPPRGTQDDLHLHTAAAQKRDMVTGRPQAMAALLGRGKNRIQPGASVSGDADVIVNSQQYSRDIHAPGSGNTMSLTGILRPDMTPVMQSNGSDIGQTPGKNPGMLSAKPLARLRPSSPLGFATLKNFKSTRPAMNLEVLPHRDISVSGIHDAHISTHGAVSGFITTSSISSSNENKPPVLSPLPSYAEVQSKSSSPMGTGSALEQGSAKVLPNSRSRSGHSLERIREDVEAENEAEDGGRQRMMRLQDHYDEEDEHEFGGSYKRYRTEDDSHEGTEMELDQFSSSHPASRHSRQDYSDRAVADPQGRDPAFRPCMLGLEGTFASLKDLMDPEEVEAICRRWEDCSQEEWMQGADEIVKEFHDILNMFKEHMAAKVKLYSMFSKQLADHKDRVHEKTEKLKDMKQSIAGDLMGMTKKGIR